MHSMIIDNHLKMNGTAPPPTPSLEQFAPHTFRFYRHALDIMQNSGVPFLVGGAYAFSFYTGIVRHTKDFDLFLRRSDVARALHAFNQAGYPAEIVFSHWLAKAYRGDDFVDIIFSSGNSMCPVDDTWFDNAVTGEVLGVKALLMPVEEMIWQKAFIMERERFDGADVNHLLHSRGRQLDWDRLLARFGPHWRVLLAHLILFGFVYPGERDIVPASVLRDLTGRLHTEPASTETESSFQGTLLSRTQYLTDTEQWGYADARLEPLGSMTEEQVAAWTNAGR